jgi:hypothetical protein
MFWRSSALRSVAAAGFIGAMFMSGQAFAQFGGVIDRVRQGADQVNGNNPTYYLKSARAVEPNICLYSNGDPSGVVGPLVFRSSYVATPNCKEFKSCSETAIPADEPKPLDCGAEIPNSKFWSRQEKALKMRSDETASIEFISEEYVQIRTCREARTPAATCTNGSVGLFRAEVEYEYPSGSSSRPNWDRFQNLAGRRTETLSRLTWLREEQSVKTGERRTTLIHFAGRPSNTVPAHGVSAVVSHRYGDREATIRFEEADDNVTHYSKLVNSANGSQDWEISGLVNSRPSPSVTKVSFLPATYLVSIEDGDLPDLLAMPSAGAMQTKYLITMYTEKSHKDETLIFQTEAENTAKSVLFTVKLDQGTLQAMKGKNKKVRVHVRAQRSGNPWIDGAVSEERIYESEKSVKFSTK